MKIHIAKVLGTLKFISRRVFESMISWFEAAHHRAYKTQLPGN